MKKSPFSEQQIAYILRQADDGLNVEEVCRQAGGANFVPFLKRYTVFNVAQCEHLPADVTKGAAPLPVCETIPRADGLIKAISADFQIGGDKAFYVPSKDFIRVPPQAAFFEQISVTQLNYRGLWQWGRSSQAPRLLSLNCRNRWPISPGQMILQVSASMNPS